MSLRVTWWNCLKKPEQIRPWGEYEILLDEKDVKVKRIRVKPNSRLSYQYHHKRQEQWTVIKGALLVVLDDEHHIVCEGESIHIPRCSSKITSSDYHWIS